MMVLRAARWPAPNRPHPPVAARCTGVDGEARDGLSSAHCAALRAADTAARPNRRGLGPRLLRERLPAGVANEGADVTGTAVRISQVRLADWIHPRLVGGCCSLRLREQLSDEWQIENRQVDCT